MKILTPEQILILHKDLMERHGLDTGLSTTILLLTEISGPEPTPCSSSWVSTKSF